MCFVLLVEDNPTFRKCLKEMLVLHFPSVAILEASNADEALEVISHREPDLVFMDIRLPGRNGLELTRAIKSTGLGTRVVVLTSCDLPEYRDAALQSGASHFFTKGSVRGEELAAVVSLTLEQKSKMCPRQSP